MYRSGNIAKRLIIICVVAGAMAALFTAFETRSGTAAGGAAVVSQGRIAPFFEENKGQFDPRVRFRAHGTPFDLWLTATDAVYVVPDRSGRTTLATAVYMRLDGASTETESVGSDRRATTFNYFQNDRPQDWKSGVQTYGNVRTSNVYPGIDMVWRTNEAGEVQYDFVAAPNADTDRIEWRIEGAKNVSIGAGGELLIDTDFGPIRQEKPLTYQESDGGLRAEVESGFELRKNGRIGFRLGEYDRSRPVIIDPSVNLSILAGSTFLGGSANDQGLDIAVDAAGNTYTTGYTGSQLFPSTPGTFDPTQNANDDIFVTKMNPAGTEIIFSTFIGGTGAEQGRGIQIDSSNNIVVAGYTTSSTYPTTVGAYDTTYNGSADVVVTKLNPTGSALIFSTFIGGSTFDEAYDLARDGSGNFYVTGRTNGGTFPTTAGAIDTTFNGTADVFVSKLDSTGATLVYSTYLGGDANDYGEAIAVDSGGNAYVTGFTADGTTVDFPSTAGAFQTVHHGTNDAFISKINSSGSALSYSTFVGGTDQDSASDIAIDASGNAYIAVNVLNGGGYPVTAGAYDTTQNGSFDVAVTVLNSAGNALIYSTYIGGSGSDVGASIALDATGSVYISGLTINSATIYPVTSGAFQTTHNGGHDVFVSRLSPSGSTLLYSTLIGGSGDDDGNGLALDQSGNVYVTGVTSATATTPFPTSPEAFQSFNAGAQDTFVVKLGDLSVFGRAVDMTGTAIANTAVAMSGSRSGFMLTDAQGYFGFGDTVFGGGFSTSATNTLYNFTPNTFTVAPLVGNTELTFVGRPTASGPTLAFANVAGEVRSSVNAIPLGNTSITLIDTVNPANSRTSTTNAVGKFNFNSIPSGRFYILIPQRPGFNFNPGYYDLALMDDQTALEFTAIPNSPRPVQDFDGDGRTDLAVFRPSEGNWYILNSQDGSFRVVHFGLPGDIPLAEDYDGDHLTDFAVFRPSEGNWYRQMSTDGFSSVHFGLGGDKPVPADFDGDGRTDLAVFRPSTGVWHRLNSSDGGYVAEQFGIASDRPITGDFDGDGRSDIAVYRDGTWYRRMSSTGTVAIDRFGVAEDRPLSGDFDGDGRTDLAVFRPSSGVWYWIGSIGETFTARQFGVSGDVPVAADFDGDGRYDPAIYRNGIWHVRRIDGSDAPASFGLGTDIPVPAGQEQ